MREQPDDYMPDIVLKPASTEEVSGILTICSAAGQALVPLGGKTGLASGHFQTDSEIGLSLERMNVIEEIDTGNRTMTVQAGCILQVASEAAAEQDLLLPMDYGARGSATIGGGISTNAGGNMVIRFGMARDIVAGAGGRARRRHGGHQSQQDAQEQHGLRPEAVVYRCRGYAGRRHPGGAAPAAPAAQPGHGAARRGGLQRCGGTAALPGRAHRRDALRL